MRAQGCQNFEDAPLKVFSPTTSIRTFWAALVKQAAVETRLKLAEPIQAPATPPA
jgi:hypothetical protein